MSSPKKRAAILAAVLVISTTALPATAAPPGSGRVTPRTAAGPASGVQKVTLVTGDVVQVSDAGGGKKAASVTPAPGRERIAFHTIEVDGGMRVLPSDAVPYISSGVLDANLFDVNELIAD